ncbi:alanine--tRNA ligase [Nanoarchaeota archaeon]
MKREALIKKYLDFFKSKKHKIIGNSPLVPENDPTVLFTTAGMHPLVPFLLGQKHPSGKKLAGLQKCIRTVDIEEVGDPFHHTLFEMLGNWSLGDYFNKESVVFSFEFLIKNLKIPKEKLAVTVFEGDKDAPKDTSSAEVWEALGIPKHKVTFMPKKDNWWGPAGETGPCGPDTEIFYYVGKDTPNKNTNPKTRPDEWVEIWNNVFLQYNKTKEGRYEELKQKNVDTGMGVERTLTILNGLDDDYLSETFLPIIKKIIELSNKRYDHKDYKKEMRIIADHLKASTFILAENIAPSNVERGYVLRRLIRRAIRYGKILGIYKNFCKDIAEVVLKMYEKDYPELKKNRKFILAELEKEEQKFAKTLENGLKAFKKFAGDKIISAKEAFFLYQSYGFPIEMIKELSKEQKSKLDEKGFHKEFEKHQELSRVGAEKKFKGGLADSTEETTKLHTATHLLNEALRKVLKKDVQQRGSNINAERARFDFSFDRKLTLEEKQEVEDLVNEKINEKIPVTKQEMSVKEAKKQGAHGVFDAKYGEKVAVYSIGDFSKEICGGPHVKNTKELGKFKIKKEESVASGVRRIKAVLEKQ